MKRFTFDHLWNAFGTWHTVSEGLFCFIDFSKTYDSVSHDYSAACFAMMGLFDEHIHPLLFRFQAPIALFLHGEVNKDRLIHPQSGVRQGCPCPPPSLQSDSPYCSKDAWHFRRTHSFALCGRPARKYS